MLTNGKHESVSQRIAKAFREIIREKRRSMNKKKENRKLAPNDNQKPMRKVLLQSQLSAASRQL